jgi:acetate kinase
MTVGDQRSLLALNCGSSSIKFALFTPGLERTLSGLIEAIGRGQTPRLRVSGEKARQFGKTDQSHADLLPRLINDIILPHAGQITGIGHRVVHGGEQFGAPIRIDAQTRQAIAELAPLAPGHQPHNLAGIDAAATALPGVGQVACFDTAFHTTVPTVRREMPLPRRYAREGLCATAFTGCPISMLRQTCPASACSGDG